MSARIVSPKIGAPLLILALGAIFFAFMLSLGGGGSAAGVNDNGTIRGSIEWTQRDSMGNVIETVSIKNTTLDLIKNDARARLGVDGTTAPTGNDDLYDNISLCSNDASGAQCTLATVANITETNPQDGTGATGGTGVFTVAVTFTATGAVTAEELQLSKGSVSDGTPATTSQIGAWQNVSITLGNGDTLTITWTVTVS